MPILLVMMILLAPPLIGHAESLPSPFNARYNVVADGFKAGEMEQRLFRTNAHTYVFETEIYPTGLVALFKSDRFVERSVWTAEDGRPVPLEYTYKHTNGKSETLERLSFDWTRNLVISIREGEEIALPLEPGMMDKLVYQVALRRDLQEGAKQFNYQVADRGNIRDYHFRVVGNERLKTALGELDTVKLERVSKGDRQTFIWVATGLDYMVVKLTQIDDGHTFSSTIASLSNNPEAKGEESGG